MTTDYKLDIGGREEQQDSCGIFQNKYSTLLVLADGMGGHKGGAVASQTFLSQAQSLYASTHRKIENPKDFFQTIINATIHKLQEYKEENSNSDPHTTCVLALIQDGKVYTRHIGDSRAYIIDDKSYQWRTKDHSVVQMLFNLGEITEDEMATHPDQNRLLKSLNSKEDTTNTFKEIDIPSKSYSVIVCSDGFWEYISIDEMREYLFQDEQENALNQMVKLAKERGGEGGDNISIAVSVKREKEDKINNILTKIIFILLIMIFSLLYIEFSKSRKESNEENKTKIIVKESNENNKTKIIVKESNENNKTKIIVKESNENNKTKIIVKESNENNKTDINSSIIKPKMDINQSNSGDSF